MERMKLEYLFIKSENDFCSTEEQFKNFLQTNMRLAIEGDQISFSGVNMEYTLNVEHITHKKQKDIIYHFAVSVRSTEDVGKLEEFDTLIRRINGELGGMFKINTIWDDVSMYYTKLLYPKIAEVESLMRKLIYRFMIRVAGGSWYKDTVPDKMKGSVENIAIRNKVDELSEDYLRYTNFDQLRIFLFEKYSIKPFDEIAVERLKDHLKEPKLKDEVETFIKNYERKSNWDRYFWDKISVENLSEKWDTLYKYRNIVAHSKQMKGEEYREVLKLIDEIKTAFVSSLAHIDNVAMTDEEVAAVQEVAKTTINPATNNIGTKLQVITNIIENFYKAYNMFAGHNGNLVSIFNQLSLLSSAPRMNSPEMISELTSQEKMLETMEMVANLPKVRITENVRKDIECIEKALKVEVEMDESLKKVAETFSDNMET